MGSRLATFLTVIGLVGATGAALAIASGGAQQPRGAATAQYKGGKHRHHHHHHHHPGSVQGVGKHRGGPGSGPGSVEGVSQTTGTQGTSEEVGLTTSSGQAGSSLPFTGEDLFIVVLVGLALAGVGFLVNLRARKTERGS